MSKPQVFAIAATTIDGFIGKDSLHQADWSSKADKNFFKTKTTEAGVMVMGHTTYKTIGRPLPNRKTIVYSRQPHTKPTNSNLEFTSKAPQQLVGELFEQGYEQIAICGGQAVYTMFFAEDLVDELYVTVSPQMFGQGLSLLSKPADLRFELTNCDNLDKNTLMLRYTRRR